MENQPQSLIDRFTSWTRESLFLKFAVIGFIILFLLIPKVMVNDLIQERFQRSLSVEQEVSNLWSGRQVITAPMIMVPWSDEVITTSPTGGRISTTVRRQLFLAADTATLHSTLETELRRRGIFEVIVYTNHLHLKARFSKPDLAVISVPAEKVHWQEAKLIMGIADVRGITGNFHLAYDTVKLKAGAQKDIGISYEPFNSISSNTYQVVATGERSGFSSGITAPLTLTSEAEITGEVTLDMELRGSQDIQFVPNAGTTRVQLESTWPSPKLTGNFAANTPEVSDSGFKAEWNVLHFNRPFAALWTDGQQQLTGFSFGATLLLPGDQYQQSERSAKYGILIILLTFMSLFLVEVSNKIKIHPFQYILIGAALVLYYILLISFAEHLGFGLAYVIATGATITLIALYSRTFFEKLSHTGLLTAILVVFYAMIYLILQAEDYALLMGSIGLFLVLAAAMYFTRKVKWNS